jgi:hypothetical protein
MKTVGYSCNQQVDVTAHSDLVSCLWTFCPITFHVEFVAVAT